MNKTDSTEAEVVKALGLNELAPEVYKDLLQPSIKEVGKNLVVVARAISIALAPLEVSVWGYDKIRSWLSASLASKLATSEPENIQPAPLHIAGPAIMNLAFCHDQEELRELYANLLASAMLKDKEPALHPSFVQVIQQLHPDEALILSYLAKVEKLGSWILESIWEALTSVEKEFEQVCIEAKVTNIKNSDTYLDNLTRLRILSKELSTETTFNPHSAYDSQAYADSYKKETHEWVVMTSFGIAFINACIRTSENLDKRI